MSVYLFINHIGGLTNQSSPLFGQPFDPGLQGVTAFYLSFFLYSNISSI
jgi:hypothetical protein